MNIGLLAVEKILPALKEAIKEELANTEEELC